MRNEWNEKRKDEYRREEVKYRKEGKWRVLMNNDNRPSMIMISQIEIST